MRVYVYEITYSAVDYVKVGSFIVDTEEGPASEWGDRRDWALFNKATVCFEDGWAGVRSARACKRCYVDHRKVRPHKHDGPHGDGPHLVPTRRAGAVTR